MFLGLPPDVNWLYKSKNLKKYLSKNISLVSFFLNFYGCDFMIFIQFTFLNGISSKELYLSFLSIQFLLKPPTTRQVFCLRLQTFMLQEVPRFSNVIGHFWLSYIDENIWK